MGQGCETLDCDHCCRCCSVAAEAMLELAAGAALLEAQVLGLLGRRWRVGCRLQRSHRWCRPALRSAESLGAHALAMHRHRGRRAGQGRERLALSKTLGQSVAAHQPTPPPSAAGRSTQHGLAPAPAVLAPQLPALAQRWTQGSAGATAKQRPPSRLAPGWRRGRQPASPGRASGVHCPVRRAPRCCQRRGARQGRRRWRFSAPSPSQGWHL